MALTCATTMVILAAFLPLTTHGQTTDHVSQPSSVAVLMTSRRPPPHQTMCLPLPPGSAGNSSCMPLATFLKNVINKTISLNATASAASAPPSTAASVSMETTQTYHSWLLRQNTSDILNEIQQVVRNLQNHVGANLTNERVRAVLRAVELLANASDVIPVTSKHVLREALLTLSRVPDMDGETVRVYAESMSGALERGVFQGPDDQGKIPIEDVTSVLEAMEHVLLTSNVSSLEQSHPAFEVSVRDIALEDVVDTAVVLYGDDSEIIELSPAMFAHSPGRVSTVVYRNLHHALPSGNRKSERSVVSRVFSVALGQRDQAKPRPRVELDHAIVFTVKHRHRQNLVLEHKRICVYWSRRERSWSRSGCRVEGKNASHTTCSCDHLTSFAVLVLYLPADTLSALHSKALVILSAVGCGLSILGLIMTLCCYVYLRILQRERILIHANLALALLLAQIVFLASQDAYKHPVACKVAAILLHFLLLAALTWMLVEGIALYLSCTRGFYHYGDMRTKYFLIGWGLPVIIVLISFGVQYPHYGDGVDRSCWLSVKSGLIWAFMGPLLLVVLFNLIVLAMVIRVYLTLRTNQHKTELAKIRGSLRALGMLLPLLGTTWLISLLVPLSSVFHYLFIIGNSLQGILLFFLHCVWNQEVRKVIAQRRVSGSGLPSSDSEMSAFWRRRTLAWHIYTRRRRQPDPQPLSRDPKERSLWI